MGSGAEGPESPATKSQDDSTDSSTVLTGEGEALDPFNTARQRTVRHRLSGLYFFHFGALGALIPYLALYLSERGFSAYEIGLLFAIKVGARLLAPNLLAWYADHHGRRMPFVRLTAAMAFLAFSGLHLVEGFAATAVVLGAWAFFFSAMLPLFEATALNHLGAKGYGSVRVWGSAGFIVAVMVLGVLLGRFGTGLLPPAMALLLLGTFAYTLGIPDRKNPDAAELGHGFVAALRRPEVLTLFAVGLLAQFAHGPYYSFLSLYLEGLGYTRATIGQMWALGVVAEIGVFLAMGRLMARHTSYTLLLWSLSLAILRWVLLVGFADKIALLAFAQVLHLASFGIFHAVTIGFVHRYFPGRLQGRGQALFFSATFGAGSALGSAAGGYLWDGFAPAAIFVASALSSAAALAIVVVWRRRFVT